MSSIRKPTTQVNIAAQRSGGSTPQGITALYRSVGEELHHFDIDVEAAALTRRGTVTVPAGIQYVWPHPSRQYLYVASSNRGPGASGDTHHLTAFRVDPATGALHAHGEPSLLPSRPIHMSLDRTGTFALTAFNLPSSVTVHRINRDGTIGALVTQPALLETGIYAHQIVAAPDNRAVILVTRGNDPAGGKPEDPGALKVFRFADGVLSNLASVSPAVVMASARGIWIFTRRSRGSMSRESGKTSSTYRVGADGTLDFVRTHDVETDGKFQWWMGMVGLPGRG